MDNDLLLKVDRKEEEWWLFIAQQVVCCDAICTKCGCGLDMTDKFCPECGQQL